MDQLLSPAGEEDIAPLEAPALSPGRLLARLAGDLTLLFASVGLLVAVIYRPWGSRLRIPIEYTGDAFVHAMYVKNMTGGGSWSSTSALGAPFGQNTQDFPAGADRVHLLLLRLISLGGQSPLTTLNVYFYLGFFLIAASAYVALRALGVPRLGAGIAATLFPFLGYRFHHGITHAFLSAYFSIPIIVVLVVWAFRGSLPDGANALWRQPRLRWMCWTALAVGVVVVSLSSPYYAIFGMLLIGMAAAFRALRSLDWRMLLMPAALIASIGVVMFAGLLPELLWQRRHGDNPVVAARSAGESETWGLHLAQVVLPDADHRVGAFASVGADARLGPFPGEEGQAIGLLAVAGLAVGLLTVTLPRPRTFVRGALARLQRDLAATAVGSFVLGTVGGLGMVVAVGGFTQIRAWNRIAIVIGFTGLAAAGIAVEQVRASALGSVRGRRVLAGAIPLLMVIGLLDQVPSGALPNWDENRAVRDVDERFVRSLGEALPEGSMVFQLPVAGFPEVGPMVDMPDYSHLIGYLFDEQGLRWSYGDIKGRRAEWQTTWSGEPPPRQIAGIAAAGFDALFVDRAGYADRGVAIEAAATALVGQPSGTSDDGRRVWFDLRRVRSALSAELSEDELATMRTSILRHVRVTVNGEIPPAGSALPLGPGDTVLELRDEIDAGGPVRISLMARAATPATVRLVADGVERTFPVPPSPVPIEVVIPMVTPSTRLVVSTDTPGVIATDLAAEDAGRREVRRMLDAFLETYSPAG